MNNPKTILLKCSDKRQPLIHTVIHSCWEPYVLPHSGQRARCRDTIAAGPNGAPRLRTRTTTLGPSVQPELLASDPVVLA